MLTRVIAKCLIDGIMALDFFVFLKHLTLSLIRPREIRPRDIRIRESQQYVTFENKETGVARESV